MEQYIVITFGSTHAAMKAESMLSRFNIEMIPTPRQLTSNCGISIKGQFEDLEAIQETMGSQFIDMSEQWLVSKEDGILTFKKA